MEESIKIIKLSIGTIFLLFACGISYWMWWLKGKIWEGKAEPLGFWAIPVSIIFAILNWGGAYLIVGFDINSIFWFAFIPFLVILVPFFIQSAQYISTTKPILVSKPLSGGKLKTYFYFFFQFAIISFLSWLIYISIKIVIKHLS